MSYVLFFSDQEKRLLKPATSRAASDKKTHTLESKPQHCTQRTKSFWSAWCDNHCQRYNRQTSMWEAEKMVCSFVTMRQPCRIFKAEHGVVTRCSENEPARNLPEASCNNRLQEINLVFGFALWNSCQHRSTSEAELWFVVLYRHEREKKMGSAESQPAGWRIQAEFLQDSSI